MKGTTHGTQGTVGGVCVSLKKIHTIPDMTVYCPLQCSPRFFIGERCASKSIPGHDRYKPGRYIGGGHAPKFTPGRDIIKVAKAAVRSGYASSWSDLVIEDVVGTWRYGDSLGARIMNKDPTKAT